MLMVMYLIPILFHFHLLVLMSYFRQLCSLNLNVVVNPYKLTNYGDETVDRSAISRPRTCRRNQFMTPFGRNRDVCPKREVNAEY